MQRHNVRSDRVIITHEGRKLRLAETAEEQGLADLGVVEVQTDFSKNVKDLRQELGATELKVESELRGQQDAKQVADMEAAGCLKIIENCKMEKRVVDREVRDIEAAKVIGCWSPHTHETSCAVRVCLLLRFGCGVLLPSKSAIFKRMYRHASQRKWQGV